MPDDVVADRGDLFVGVCVGEWRHRVVATKRSDPDAFKYGADNICAGGVIHAPRAAKSCIVALLQLAQAEANTWKPALSSRSAPGDHAVAPFNVPGSWTIRAASSDRCAGTVLKYRVSAAMSSEDR